MTKSKATSEPVLPIGKSETPAMEMRIEYMALSELIQRRYSANPKDHDLGLLHKMFGEFGYTMPVMIDETTGGLVAGHGRLDTLAQAKQSGQQPPERIKADEQDWYVPVVRGVAFDDPTAALAYIVADNQSVMAGGWYDNELAAILQQVNEQRPQTLAATGYDTDDLAALIKQFEQQGGVLGAGQKTNDAPEGQGRTPEDKLDGFLAATVKQVVLFFPHERYVEVLAELEAIAEENGIETHTEVFEHLLRVYHSVNR